MKNFKRISVVFIPVIFLFFMLFYCLTRPSHMAADHWKDVKPKVDTSYISVVPIEPEKYLSEEELAIYKSYTKDPTRQKEILVAFLEQKLQSMVKFNFNIIDEHKKSLQEIQDLQRKLAKYEK